MNRRFFIAILSASVFSLLCLNTVFAENPVWVGVFTTGSTTATGPKNLQRFLTPENGFRCELLTAEEIQAGRLKAFDLLIMPGGSGSKQSKMLGETGRKNIQEFVKNGGGYIGICAGSYLASSDYEWSLHLINAKVFDREHWARGTGEVTIKFTDDGQKLLEHESDKMNVYYGQGPLLIPDTKDYLPKFESLATYETEIALKGAPTGVMIGTTAIARSEYGKGKVMCISPHPESSEKTEHVVKSAVKWVCGRDLEILGKPATPEKQPADKPEAGEKAAVE